MPCGCLGMEPIRCGCHDRCGLSEMRGVETGASTTCRKFGYRPDDDESSTRHLLVTDHDLNREQLDEVSEKVKAGTPIDFPPEVLRQAWVSKADVEKSN